MALRGGDGWETPALVVVVLVDLLKGDCRGIVRTQRLRHAQPAVSLFLPQPIQSPSNNRDTRGKADGPVSQDAQKQNETEEGKEKKQPRRKEKSGSAWPVLAADWAACFFIDEPCSFHFHHHCSAGGSSERMHGGMGNGMHVASAAAREDLGRRDAMRCDAMVPVTDSRVETTFAVAVWSVVDDSGEVVVHSSRSICRRLLNARDVKWCLVAIVETRASYLKNQRSSDEYNLSEILALTAGTATATAV